MVTTHLAPAAQDTQLAWIPLVVAIIAAFAAVVGAVVAGRSAKALKIAELEVQRVRDLENRISERKYETYRPMIELLRDMIDPGKSAALLKEPNVFKDRIADFSVWIVIYGSDESVRAFHNFMQAVYSGPPAPVLMRLYADFQLSVRRDIGNQNTGVERLHLLGIRINDLYDPAKPTFHASLTDSFEEVCRANDWMPPWEREATPPGKPLEA